MPRPTLWLAALGAALLGCSGGASAPDGAAGNGAAGDGGGAGAAGTPADFVVATFLVALTTEPQASANVYGTVTNGASFDPFVWKVGTKDGVCTLFLPDPPFCATPCGSGSDCVAADTCRAKAVAKDIGPVTVTGVKTEGGGSSLALTKIGGGYAAADMTPAYPPFDEGAEVSASAPASAAGGAFQIVAKGIAPLVVPGGAITIERNKPLALTWTAKGTAGDSTIHVHVDLSHHGGAKGKIDCDAADTGSLTISAPLVTALMNLGLAGFPKLELTRVARGSASTALGSWTLELSHLITRDVAIPGLDSCNADIPCPTGKTCNLDNDTCK